MEHRSFISYSVLSSDRAFSLGTEVDDRLRTLRLSSSTEKRADDADVRHEIRRGP